MARCYLVPLSDDDLIEAVKTHMENHKYVTRGQLKTKFHTSMQRLEALEKAGHFKLPLRLSKSAASTLGRKKCGTAKNWYITRPAPWQVAAN